jgi:hypothetical protein
MNRTTIVALAVVASACSSKENYSVASGPRDWSAHPAVIELDQPNELFAMSDVHGGYDRMAALLLKHHVIATIPAAPAAMDWAAGDSVLVVAGDMIDKGGQSLEVLDALRALEASAVARGGRVVVAILRLSLKAVRARPTRQGRLGTAPSSRGRFTELGGKHEANEDAEARLIGASTDRPGKRDADSKGHADWIRVRDEVRCEHERPRTSAVRFELDAREAEAPFISHTNQHRDAGPRSKAIALRSKRFGAEACADREETPPYASAKVERRRERRFARLN